MTIKKGDKVKVEYEGKFDDGTVFDSSEKHGKPLEFEAGAGHVIKGFDATVIGMKKGEEKEVKIKPAEGYGDYNEKLIKKVPRKNFPADKEIKAGMMIGLESKESGHKMAAVIKEVTDKEVTIDMNHPLAGKNLNFKIKVVE